MLLRKRFILHQGCTMQPSTPLSLHALYRLWLPNAFHIVHLMWHITFTLSAMGLGQHAGLPERRKVSKLSNNVMFRNGTDETYLSNDSSPL